MSRLLVRFIALGAISLAMACGKDPEPVGPSVPVPSLERCGALTTQRECFAQGCHFFTSAAPLTMEGDTCSQGSSLGTCLYAPDSDDVQDSLTFYQRTNDDGSREILQLNVDAPVQGWTRCGSLDAPPDCDCDGKPDDAP
jgi:hypothetical protein